MDTSADESDDEVLKLAQARLANRRVLSRQPSLESRGSVDSYRNNIANNIQASQTTSSRRPPSAGVSLPARSDPPLAAPRATATQASKEAAKLQREEERAQKKLETALRKQQEKEERQRKREREREGKTRKKEEERLTKKQNTERGRQEAGKYAHEEVVLLMDSHIYRNSEYDLVRVLEEDFLMAEYPSALTCTKSIQFIRRDYLQGGGKTALENLQAGESSGYEHIPYLLLLLEAEDFIELIQKDAADVDDDFPKLEKWLTDLKGRWKSIWGKDKDPRVILILNNVSATLDRQWIDHRKASNRSGPSPPTEWDLQDSIQWLLIQFQVDCIQCTTIEQVQANVHKLTRGLAEAPYAKNISELECVRKIKQDENVGEDPFSKAADTWLRQLQMMPKVSEVRARNLVQHYPTLHSLWEAYKDGDEASNAALLNYCFDQRSSQSLLSATVHKIFTCKDPNEMV